MEWQPIYTAPKDGTRILVHGNYGFAIANWAGDNYPHWVDCDGRMEDEACTHWMPLPEPPKGD